MIRRLSVHRNTNQTSSIEDAIRDMSNKSDTPRPSGRPRYNEQFQEQDISMFEACAAAQARGQEVYLQFTCQPLSFDFTLAAAYPFYSHPAFDRIKAYDREQLKTVFRDPSFRERFRENLRNPIPGTIFQGNWNRVIVAAPVKPENAGLAECAIADIAHSASPGAIRSTCCSISGSRRTSIPG